MKKNKPKKQDELITGSVPHIKGVVKKDYPWGNIIFITTSVLILITMAIIVLPKYFKAHEEGTFTPSYVKTDPSNYIEGVYKKYYPYVTHISSSDRVKYEQNPPIGGPTTLEWATCNGNIYTVAIKNENAVRSLSNGAIWITYDPEKLDAKKIKKLSEYILGKDYIFMSPYPNLDTPISIQSWGHQLKLSDPEDKRIEQFILALKLNKHVQIYEEDKLMSAYPLVGSSCSITKGFNPKSPNLFSAIPTKAPYVDIRGIKVLPKNV